MSTYAYSDVNFADSGEGMFYNSVLRLGEYNVIVYMWYRKYVLPMRIDQVHSFLLFNFLMQQEKCFFVYL